MPIRQKRTKLSFYSSRKKKPAPKKETDVRNEIYGLLFFSLGILMLVAIISYHPTDPTGSLSVENSYQVKNYLGIIGAIFSYYIFQWTFGYPAVVFPLIFLLFSYGMFARSSFNRLFQAAGYFLLWGWVISIALALPKTITGHGEVLDFYPSGLLGGIIAIYLVKFLGNFAAVFIWLVTFLSLMILTFRVRFSKIPLFLIQTVVAGFQLMQHGVLFIVEHTYQFLNEIFGHFKIKKKEKPIPVSGNEFLDTVPIRKPIPEKKIPGSGVDITDKKEISEPEIVTNEDLLAETLRERQSQVEEKKEKPVEIAPPVVKESPIDKDTVSSAQPNFEIEEAVKEKELDYDSLVRSSLKKYQFPSTELLNDIPSEFKVPREELMAKARLLEKTLSQFGVKAHVKRVVEGPVITLYVVQPAEGVKINQISNLSDDLALALRAEAIRIIAPLPGEAAIGIEIPNEHPSIVHFRSIVRSEKFIHAEGDLVLGMGKTISGEVFCADLTKLPHLLVAGATGAGKSVGINSMIASILYRVPPSDVKFVLIDPKKLELSIYAKLKDHYLATCKELNEIVITHPQNAILILRSVVNEMEERYDKLAQLGVRDIVSYNKKIERYQAAGEKSDEFRRLPYIIVIIDELADLILTAAREVEEPITRLAQMARAVGIHLIVATQRPSVDILTGLIKANFPARIAYQVATRPDSKVILDMYGAEKLIGNGDMLFMPAGILKPIRLQSPLITTEEVERIIRHIRKQPKFPPYHLKYIREKTTIGPGSVSAFDEDELFERAREIVIRHQQGSISLLQRKLKIGYARAARLIDALEEAGVVGPGQGSKARDVLISAYNDEENHEN